MSKYNILAITIPNLVELGPIFDPVRPIFPVRQIMSGVLKENFNNLPSLEATVGRLRTGIFA